jgi:demethylspheroidene O-methyltransferase
MATLSAGRFGATAFDQIRDWRSRIIADARFQSWARNSPLTRRLAQRKARALFDICAGFVYSQVLSACVKLEVFELLRGGPKTCEALAPRIALSVPAARRLLKAAASLRLLRELPNDRFALDDLGAAMIGNPGIAAFVAHHDLLYSDLRDPVALLRGEHETALSRFWPYAANRPDATDSDAAQPDANRCGAYSELMSRTQALVVETVLDAYPFDRHRRLMDVGGGEGAFLVAAAKRAPTLEFTLFDLPAVAGRARERLGPLGLGGRVETIGGDMLRDPLPRGADVMSLVRVLHDHDDESARVLIAAIHDALPRGGAIVVAEPMAGAPGAEPMGDAYFGFYLLAMGRGRPRTMDEIAQLLNAAGFEAGREAKTRNPLVVSVFVARRV